MENGINHSEIARTTIRDQVHLIEDDLKQFPQVDIPIKHYFAPGVYIREILIPKDTWLTGKIHKFPQFHVITKGELSILLNGQMVRVKAPCNIMSPAGAKRLAYAHEDTIWLMVHGTHEVDIDKIEHHFIAGSEEEYNKFINEEKRQLTLFKDEQ